MHCVRTNQFAIYSITDSNISHINDIVLPDTKGFYKILWILDGTGSYSTDEEKNSLKPAHFYCLAAGRQMSMDPQTACSGYLILFNYKFLNENGDKDDHIRPHLVHHYFQGTRVVKANPPFTRPMADALFSLQKENINRGLLNDEMQIRYFRIFLLYFMQHLLTQKPAKALPGNRILTQRYLGLVEQHYTTQKLVTDYARDLFITPNYLNKIVKDETGLTAREHIQQKIVAEAKSMLYTQGLTMKEVAYQLGFEDMGHFSKFFKKTCGQNFSHLRKMLNANYT